MLGPVDLLDWTFDECDALRADIRLSAGYKRYKLRPSEALGSGLAISLRKFNSGRELTATELGDLLQRLQSSGLYGADRQGQAAGRD